MKNKAIIIISALLALGTASGCGASTTVLESSVVSEEVQSSAEESSFVSEVVQSSIQENSGVSIQVFSDVDDIVLYPQEDRTLSKGEEVKGSIFLNIENYEDYISDIEVISSNPDVATIVKNPKTYNNLFYYTLTGVSAGTTEIYAQTKDGKIMTKKRTITVISDEQNSKIEISNEESSKTEVSKEESNSLEYYTSGTYKVGTDIPAGEYIIYPTGSISGYYQVCSDSTGDFDSIINNENFNGQMYLTVSEEQYLTISRSNMYPVSKAKVVDKSSGIIKEGMYKVGTDIPAGEYKLTCTDTSRGYLCVYSSSVCAFNDIVTNDNFEGSTYITVQNGQYLYISRCVLNLS